LPLAAPVLQTTLDRRTPDRRGKVRDIYDFGDRLLIVATDRISAFDYLERVDWNKQPPAPAPPEDVVAKTREKYVEAFERLTLRELR